MRLSGPSSKCKVLLVTELRVEMISECLHNSFSPVVPAAEAQSCCVGDLKLVAERRHGGRTPETSLSRLLRDEKGLQCLAVAQQFRQPLVTGSKFCSLLRKYGRM